VNWLKTNIGGKVYFYPMIEFVDREGKRIRFKASERSEREPMYKTGTEVIIKYDPKNTDRKKVAYPKKSR